MRNKYLLKTEKKKKKTHLAINIFLLAIGIFLFSSIAPYENIVSFLQTKIEK